MSSANEVNKVSSVMLVVGFIVPLVVATILSLIWVNPFEDNAGEHIVSSVVMGIIVLSIILYILVYTLIIPIILRSNEKKLKKLCYENGCNFQFYFRGRTSAIVAVDAENRKMGLLFKMNPTHPYVVDLNEVSDARTYNGASSLSMGGTREVCFRFKLGSNNIKVVTFSANTTCSLKSRYVMEAVAKADRIVGAMGVSVNG